VQSTLASSVMRLRTLLPLALCLAPGRGEDCFEYE
jgi:hypothetical protein